MRPVLAVAAATLALAAAAAYARAFTLGVQDDRLFLGAPLTSGGALLGPADGVDAARRLGATRLKLLVRWAMVEPERGAPLRLARHDAVVDLARRSGLRVQLTLGGPAPAWATGDGRVGGRRPDAAAYGRFAGAIAARFRGRVARYAIWNEPNWHGELTPARDAPARYRALYRRGWPAIRAADPRARVLFGELAPLGRPEAATPPLRFLRAATCSDRRWGAARRCAPLQTDGFAHHPYTLRWSPSFPGASPDDVTTGSLSRLTAALARLARRGALRTPAGRPPALYLTEWGWHARSRRIPEPLRSRYVAEGLALVARRPDVRELVWYQLAGVPREERGWDTGLLEHNGTPRPAFATLRGAFRALTRSAR